MVVALGHAAFLDSNNDDLHFCTYFDGCVSERRRHLREHRRKVSSTPKIILLIYAKRVEGTFA